MGIFDSLKISDVRSLESFHPSSGPASADTFLNGMEGYSFNAGHRCDVNVESAMGVLAIWKRVDVSRGAVTRWRF